MASVEVTSSGGVGSGVRKIVRTSTGVIYVVLINGTAIEVWKSTDGTSWAEQDTGNNPDSTGYQHPSCAIDSNDIIHIAYSANVSMTGGTRYVKFHTVDAATNKNTFQGDELAQALVKQPVKENSIEVDANDDPHIAYVNNAANMGTDFNTVFYTNKIGGSWNTKVEIKGAAAEKNCLTPSLFIGQPTNSVGADRPIVSFRNTSDGNAEITHGGALNATSFVTEFAYQTTNDVFTNCAIDSNNDIHATSRNASVHLMIRTHLATQATWATWETEETASTTGYNTDSLAIDGTNRYIFAESVTPNDIDLIKDEGSGFSSSTLETGTFVNVKAKWAAKNNNQGATQIDYVFGESGTVRWNKHVFAAAIIPAFPLIINQSAMI